MLYFLWINAMCEVYFTCVQILQNIEINLSQFPFKVEFWTV